MFARLFAEAGLSLDRLRTLVEVGAAGSMVRAAGGDPVRQSLYSRQIKELEDFFRRELIERHGKGIRLTPSGRELARISRFFLLGLANFQRACLAEEQVFRLGVSATVAERLLLPAIACRQLEDSAIRYGVEIVSDADIERRLHDLTLDFGVVTQPGLSRPLQLGQIREWTLKLWVPKAGFTQAKAALRAFQARQLPLALALEELPAEARLWFKDYEPDLVCPNFLLARAALNDGVLASVLPDFLGPDHPPAFHELPLPEPKTEPFRYWLAWNPRLLRLNPHAVEQRDFLLARLARGGC